MIFSESRFPPIGSSPRACFSGSCSNTGRAGAGMRLGCRRLLIHVQQIVGQVGDLLVVNRRQDLRHRRVVAVPAVVFVGPQRFYEIIFVLAGDAGSVVAPGIIRLVAYAMSQGGKFPWRIIHRIVLSCPRFIEPTSYRAHVLSSPCLIEPVFYRVCDCTIALLSLPMCRRCMDVARRGECL
jgi:hypothetical protein